MQVRWPYRIASCLDALLFFRMNLKSRGSVVLHALLILYTRRVISFKRPKPIWLVPLITHDFSNLPIITDIKCHLHYTPDLTNWELSLTLVPELFRNLRSLLLPSSFLSLIHIPNPSFISSGTGTWIDTYHISQSQVPGAVDRFTMYGTCQTK